jgi:hypothetical protein
MAKKRQTFGKMIRERERAEKRARKQEKKDARKAMIEAGLDPFAEDPYGENTPEAVPPEGEPGTGVTPSETGVTPPGQNRPS